MSKTDAVSEADGMSKTDGMGNPDTVGKIRLAVVGSRTLNVEIEQFIPPDLEIGVIVSGGAKGVDSRAAEYADRNGLDLIVFRPDYGRFGRGAPLRRNDLIVEAADLVLIIWDGVSRGSQYVIRQCQKTGKPYRICRVN